MRLPLCNETFPLILYVANEFKTDLKIRPGDVITFIHPTSMQLTIKRVYALGGGRVHLGDEPILVCRRGLERN